MGRTLAKGTRGGSRGGGGGGLNPSDILDTKDMVSQRETRQGMVDEVLSASKDVNDKYGKAGVIDQLQTATLKPKAQSTIAYYDGANIAMNERFFRDKATLEQSYAECVKEGFHPPKGNKTAAEAVTYHEYGHALTDAVAQRMGFTGPGALQMAATSICNEARAATKHRGVVIMARKISGYATHSNAEAVAEAVADVFCNGNGAKRESRAIVSVIDKYLLS